MPYIKRNSDGEVVAISQSLEPGFTELLPNSDPSILKFIQNVGGDQVRMVESDIEFVRVLEDLIDVLVAKNYILLTDLPEIAQEKMRERQVLRGKLSTRLELLSDDDDGFF
ncbi:hypothetical protein SAMN02745866_03889 [Alteromonadaceae bacterium Bs31]|nr:hypothetical protein SAMN02745866_03889 [Alteromonadaceae bacterium Bs31]